MEQKVMDGGDTPFLPQEIITSILIRLPVKTLIRFQCVCKQWKNLIKTPSFIADHLHHFSHQNPSLLLQRIGRNGSMHLYLLDRESQLLEFPTQFLEFQKMDDLSDAKIICSSHGLLCVEIGKYRTLHHSVLLWNPAIREIREVHRTIKDFESYYSFGFGFSPIVKDYKIVKTYAARFHKGVKQVEVYSLSTGSWKEIELGNLERVTLLEETVTVNGVMYWVGIKLDVGGGDKDGNKVVSFDMATEVFTLMPCPAVDIDSSPAFKLTAYDNKLAVLNLPYIGTSESSSFDLWIMEECASPSGKRWSWTKKYRSLTYPFYLDPVTLWRNNIVCYVSEDEMDNHELQTLLSLHLLPTNEFEILFIRRCFLNIVNYVESLVPVYKVEDPRS